MQSAASWRIPAVISLGLVLIAELAPALATEAQPSRLPLSISEKVDLLYGRLAFGARPGEEEKLSKQGEAGIQRWIDDQLHPERIPDSEVESKLAGLRAPGLAPEELLKRYRKLKDVAEEMGLVKGDFEQDEGLKKRLRKQIGEEKLPEEIVRQMSAQRLIRATESRRQLQEVLVDFWLNHFNIDISKGEERWLLPDFERKVIRAHLFGKFGDMLRASAHSPAMLFYLDNHLSQGASLARGRRPKGNTGLNENYAREILELHTLGVDGGYTQRDVTELARILTGWSIEDLKHQPEFKFKQRVHDRGEKVFLGRRFEAGRGIEEGEQALDMLIGQPSTAKLIATKLARYFVSDAPPAPLVKRLAEKFTATGGDLRAVYTELFSSPELWSRAAYRAKVKKPVQFVASSVRALGGELELGTKLPHLLASMGEELYRCAPPTGYKDVASAWVNPGAMVNRLNFGVKLAANRIDGVYAPLPRVSVGGTGSSSSSGEDDARKLVREVESRLLHERLSENTEKVILRELELEHPRMADGEVRPLSLAKATGLILGSPEFQRR